MNDDKVFQQQNNNEWFHTNRTEANQNYINSNPNIPPVQQQTFVNPNPTVQQAQSQQTFVNPSPVVEPVQQQTFVNPNPTVQQAQSQQTFVNPSPTVEPIQQQTFVNPSPTVQQAQPQQTFVSPSPTVEPIQQQTFVNPNPTVQQAQPQQTFVNSSPVETQKPYLNSNIEDNQEVIPHEENTNPINSWTWDVGSCNYDELEPTEEQLKILSHTVNKYAYMLLAIVFGTFGLHKFYAGQPIRGILFLAFFWTGVPTIIGIIQGIFTIFRSADCNGNIVI